MIGALLGLWLTVAAWAQEPPPEVEPGSVRKTYVVKPGDTLRTIADDHAFLVDDLARWNDLKSADRIEVGQELVMWVAPLEPVAGTPSSVGDPAAPPAEGKEPREPKRDRTTDERDGVGFFVGAQVGPSLSLNPLAPAVLPRFEAGVELPGWERRLRIFVAGTWARPVEEATADDPRVAGGSYDYRLEQTEITGALGLTLRITGIGRLVPELSAGPAIWHHRSVADGSASGAPFGESTETYTRPGVYASAGVALPLGPGELNGQVAFATTGFGGLVTGDAAAAALTPLVGYRFVF